MVRKIQTRNGAAIMLSSLLFLSACRSTDTENTLTDSGPVAVNFRLAGSEYSGSDIAGMASLDKGSVLVNKTQSYTELLTPSTVVTAELLPSVENIKASASVGNNAVAAIPGNALAPGIMFRTIAYNPDGSYQTYQDYTMGQTPTPMILQAGTAYTFVCYSYGTTTLPAISTGEQTNISSAQANYSDVNRDFMYQKVTYTPTSTVSTNTFDFTLRHKVAQITTVVNSVGMGNITAVSGAVLAPHYSNGVFPLSTGVMTGRTTTTTGSALSFSGLGTTQVTAAPVFVNADTGGSATGDLSATSMTIGGVTKSVSISNFFKITPENKSTLTINFKKCGAYLGAGNTQWKEFACHNLGANTSADPFTPAAAIHGLKIQWGRPITGINGVYYYDQASDQANSGSVPGWNTTQTPDNAWTDATKTANDPCPAGYRVPTIAQWQAVVANNSVTRVGTWTNSSTNYSSGIRFGNNLFLPAAGFRGTSPSNLVGRGSNGNYWASTQAPSPSANRLAFDGSTYLNTTATNGARAFGASLRCITE
ncbi:hypothetical protein [Elizabethkingia anophelis]|uniref:hypothetical protein n=1 Tax=Elizabethkingia anophelis TaxID=1117645 RepID=UPI00301DBDCA